MENFIPIKGYENLYEISNYGNVKSLPKYKNKKSIILKKGYFGSGKLIYDFVYLYKDTKRKKFSIHRLVAEGFILNSETKPIVNHIDNDGQNNHYNNLEWATHSENMIHSFKQGRSPQALKNITKAQEDKKTKATSDISKKLGIRFISVSEKTINKRMRKFVSFYCILCNEETTMRTDSSAVKKHNGKCIKCRYKK